MKIIYHDGGILECNTIYFTEKEVIADDIYIVPLDEILRIESA